MHLFPSSYICTECTQVYLEQFTERNPETSWLTSSYGVNRESHTKTPRESWDTPGHKPHTQHRAIQPGGKPQLPASLWEWRIRNTHLVPPLLQLPPEWWPPKHLARKSPRRASRCALRHSAVSNSLQHHGLQPTRLLYPQSFPRKNIGTGCHFLLQGIFRRPRNWILVLESPVLAGRFFTTVPPGEPQLLHSGVSCYFYKEVVLKTRALATFIVTRLGTERAGKHYHLPGFPWKGCDCNFTSCCRRVQLLMSKHLHTVLHVSLLRDQGSEWALSCLLPKAPSNNKVKLPVC